MSKYSKKVCSFSYLTAFIFFCRVVSPCLPFTIFKMLFCQVVLNSLQATCKVCSVELISNKVTCAYTALIFFEKKRRYLNTKCDPGCQFLAIFKTKFY